MADFVRELIEAGVPAASSKQAYGKGGLTILMRGILRAYAISERRDVSDRVTAPGSSGKERSR